MISTSSMNITTDDKLIKQWVKNCADHEEKVYTQRKRLPKSTTQFTKTIQKVYLDFGPIKAINTIKDLMKLDLDDCWDLFDHARGKKVKYEKLENFKLIIGY